MSMQPEAPVSRREILQGLGALVLGAVVPLPGPGGRVLGAEAAAAPHVANAFVRIAADSTVTVISPNIEFGQGTFTGFTTLVADELDADWSQMRAESAPADVKLYANPVFGAQGTGGSTSMYGFYANIRKAGAAARALIVGAAAQTWSVPAGEISIERGVVRHAASGRQGRFGDFVATAALLTPPADPVLKTPDRFVHIGRRLPKLDTRAKTDGSARYTLDVYRENMLTAVVAHPPKFGATVASFDDAATRKVRGVVDVKRLDSGVAVYATNTWAALRGRQALTVQWNETAAEQRSTAETEAAALALARTRGKVAGERGSVDAALAAGHRVIEAEYTFPYLAHAPLEPLDAVVERRGDLVEVWTGSQFQTVDHMVVAKICGVKSEQVKINTMLAGGSFGRRAQPASEFMTEAAAAFMAAGGQRPVKLMWTREDDIRGGFYRPQTVHRLRGAIDAKGDIVAWEQVIAGRSILIGTSFEGAVKNGIDMSMVEGASDLAYAIPNLNVSVHVTKSAVPVLWWRSVGHTHTGYTVETFIDELLERAGKDPIEGRLALLGEHPRMAGVLRRVAEISKWGSPLPAGRARGVAVVHSFNSWVAEVAEVSVGPSGEPRVHKVWCAVDCGRVVNPDIVVAQMEGGIGYGLGAVLYNEITLEKGGTVRQSNFHDYRSLRIDEMPEIEVALMPSEEPPTGVGEPGTPPIMPAVANALRRLTGKAARRLPIVRRA
ncbi:MAG: xanthine dehydrogenase family protein molybdopterin-binding subunit [Steroidobacteraceae bacterium]